MGTKLFSGNSKPLFIIEGCLGTSIYILTTGTILSGYAYFLGANASQISIIATLPALLNAVQLLSARVLKSRSRNKNLIIAGNCIHRFLMGCMFLLPFLNIASEAKVWLLGITYGISYLLYDFIATGLGDWMLHSVDAREVGRFLGLKDSLSLAALTITSLVVGKMLDYYELRGMEEIGFLIVGITIIIMTILDFIDLMHIEEVETPVATRKTTLWQDIKEPFMNKQFCGVMGFYGLWNVSLYLANAFYAIYMVAYLELEYFFIMLVGMACYLSRIISANIWGKFADRISWIWVNRWSTAILGFSVMSWIFVDKNTYMWLLPVNQTMAGIAWGGIVISIFNMQYLFAPADNKVLYVSVNTAMTNIIGFCSALLGVQLMNVFPDTVWGDFSVQGIQWVIFLSGILMCCTALFNKIFLEK